MHDPVKVGVVGCGRVAQAQHLRVLSALPGVHLAALADADEASLNKAADRFAPDASRHASYQAMLEQAEIQAAVICLPTALHADAAIASFKAGKAVYLEKPIGVDLAEARRVVEAHAASGQFAQMGFNYRFHPAYTALRQSLERGQVGQVVAVATAFCSPPRPLPPWKRSAASGGGAIFDLFVHHADLVAYLLDQPIVRVAAGKRDLDSEEDTAALSCELSDGTLMQSLVSSGTAQTDRVEVFGKSGVLSVDRFVDTLPRCGKLRRATDRKRRLMEVFGATVRGLRGLGRGGGEPTYQLALASFVESIRAGREPLHGLATGVAAAAVVEAARRALATGAWAEVEDTTQWVDARSTEAMVGAHR